MTCLKLKCVWTMAFLGLCDGLYSCLNWTVWQGCARDLSGRDRDETRDAKVRDRDETETLGILSETRPRPRR